MRLRAPVVLLVVVLACLLGPPAAAAAEDYLRPYTSIVDQGDLGELAQVGVDIDHAGWDPSGPAEQEVAVALFAAQARTLEARGVDLEPMPLPEASHKSAAAGDSPNPYYNVYRQFMGEGGIHDEMLQIAKDNKDVVKYERIGTSTLGKPMAVLKMTADARNTADGTRPAVFFSSNNHAREWIAAEVQRRLMGWFAANKDEPGVKRLLETREIWFMPIQNPDGYDYTFTCGTGDDNHLCPSGETPTNRFWRKTLRDNNGNGIYGDPSDGVDPNRNYPAKRGIDEEGASNSFTSGTHRGPYALSEPENLAFDRLLRKIPFKANVNYHSAGQLLLTPVSYITDYAPNDATIFNAMTGVDGDGAVEPYTPQRSSDLYESNGDTIDNAYLNYGVIGWTPELDTCATGGGPTGCNQFDFPDDEGKVQAIFEKNLPMALNIVHSADRLDRPRNYENDPGQYQVKPTQDIQINEFDVSYGATQTIEAIVRRSLGPVDVNATISGPGGDTRTVVLRAEDAPAGERYGDAAGAYFHRVRVTTPENWASSSQPVRNAAPGDVVSLSVRAGGLRQRMSYRVESVPDADEDTKRVLVVAAEDYTGSSPNRSGPYDTSPRYLDEYATALQGLGYDVATFDVDDPPDNADDSASLKHPTALGVLSHFDAVVFESGDDFIPQEASESDPRHLSTPTTQSGSFTLAPWAHKAMIALRDYLNEGGKLVVGGRNAHQWPIGSSNLSATGPYEWAPDKVFGFFYPESNGGDDDLPGTAFQRYRDISNDTWQNYLGVVGRATAGTASSGYGNTALDAEAMTAKAGGIFDGMTPFTLDTAAGDDPNEDVGRRRGAAREVADAAAQLDLDLDPGAAAPGARRARRDDPAGPDGWHGALHGRHRHVRVRPRAGRRSGPRRAARPLARAPAAHDGRHDGAAGGIQGPGVRQRADVHAARPGGGRRDGRRRAGRHEGGPPAGRRRAGRPRGHVPVPVPLDAEGLRRRQDGHPDGAGGGRRGQRRDRDARDRRDVRGRGARGAPPRGPTGARGRRDGRQHAQLRQRRVRQLADVVPLRVAGRRQPDRRRGRHAAHARPGRARADGRVPDDRGQRRRRGRRDERGPLRLGRRVRPGRASRHAGHSRERRASPALVRRSPRSGARSARRSRSSASCGRCCAAPPAPACA